MEYNLSVLHIWSIPSESKGQWYYYAIFNSMKLESREELGCEQEWKLFYKDMIQVKLAGKIDKVNNWELYIINEGRAT